MQLQTVVSSGLSYQRYCCHPLLTTEQLSQLLTGRPIEGNPQIHAPLADGHAEVLTRIKCDLIKVALTCRKFVLSWLVWSKLGNIMPRVSRVPVVRLIVAICRQCHE